MLISPAYSTPLTLPAWQVFPLELPLVAAVTNGTAASLDTEVQLATRGSLVFQLPTYLHLSIVLPLFGRPGAYVGAETALVRDLDNPFACL